MNKGVSFFLGLIFGAAVGGFVSYKLLQDKFSQEADERINACQEAFLNELARRRENDRKKAEEEAREKAEKAIQTYSPEPVAVKEFSESVDKQEGKEPYEISQEIYGEESNPNKRVGLIYFPNENVLIDENKNVMSAKQIETTIGLKALGLFDDDTDAVIMRNEQTGCDYEIAMSGISLLEWRKRYSAPGK